MKLVMVGESWGEREDMFKHALVGASGMELILMLDQSGLTEFPFRITCFNCKESVNLGRCPHCGEYYKPNELELIKYWDFLESKDEILTTNVFPFHPPNNNVEYFFGPRNGEVCLDIPPIKLGKYLLKEHRHYLDRLWHEIEAAEPNLIVLMGNTPSWAILGITPKISEIRGTINRSVINGFKCLPTFHPAYVLRQWTERTTVLADFQKAKAEADSQAFKRTERWILINPALSEIAEWLAHPADFYAVDIESGYALYTKAELKRFTPQMRFILASQISMIGFARSPSQALVIPFMSRNSPGMNYWPLVSEELIAWLYVQKALKSTIPKCFQNGIYDISRLLLAGMRPRNCKDDTMLMSHSLWPERRKSLGFLASFFLNEVAWKTWYGSGESIKRDD